MRISKIETTPSAANYEPFHFYTMIFTFFSFCFSQAAAVTASAKAAVAAPAGYTMQIFVKTLTGKVRRIMHFRSD